MKLRSLINMAAGLGFGLGAIPAELRAADPAPQAETAPAKATVEEAKGKGPAGIWLGALNVGAVRLRLGLELAEVGGTLQGNLTSLDQGSPKIKVDEATFADGSLKIVLKSIRGTFEGKLSDDGSKLVGTWEQGPGKLPLTLERVDKLPS